MFLGLTMVLMDKIVDNQMRAVIKVIIIVPIQEEQGSTKKNRTEGFVESRLLDSSLVRVREPAHGGRTPPCLLRWSIGR